MTNNEALAGTANSNTQTNRNGDDTYVVSVVAANFNAAGELVNVAAEDVFTESNGTAGGVDTVKLRGNPQLAGSLASLNVDLNNPLFANIENLDVSETGDTKFNLKGNAENNVLTGNAASNLLDGGAGADELIGGLGDDIYIIDAIATGFDEAGKVISGAIEDTLVESYGILGGFDTVKVRSNLQFADSVGTLTLDLNNAYFANIENLDVSLTGNAKLNLIGSDESNVITGNDADNIIWSGLGNDVLIGGLGNDTLNGGLGNDMLDGGAGADELIGGLGDDIYIIDAIATGFDKAGKVISAAIEDTLVENNGTAEGIDTVKVRSNLQFADSLGRLNIDLSNPFFTNIENIDISELANAQLNLIGNNKNNVLTGNAADNFIEGGGGDDVLNGGAGNDSLDGSAGADTLFGGTGNDTYVIDTLATGFDAAGKVISATLQDSFTENNATQDGIDTVRLRGELLFADSIGKVALELSNPLFANIENLDVSETGRTKLDLIGNSENNLLIGNAANNYMTGGGGKNILYGGAGNDTLDSGSAGSQDLLFGGAGDDTYIIDIELRKLTDANGVYLQNPNNVQITLNDYFIEDDIAAGGNDTLKVIFAGDSAYKYEAELDIKLKDQLPGIENLDISGITGVNTRFRLFGTDNGSQLIGRKDGENGLFDGKGDDRLIGGDKADSLYDGDGNDYLFGGAGNDYINSSGRYGGMDSYVDTLVGGDGDDFYAVDLIATEVDALKNVIAYKIPDKIIEESGLAGGNDTAYLYLKDSVSYSKITIDMNDGNFANIENIAVDSFNLSSDGVLTLLGNSEDNILSGAYQNNLIYGGAGNDTIYGNSYANDTLLGGAGNDTLVDVYSFWGGGKDFFYGGEGNDLLKTQGGNDALFGESGDDRFETRFDANPTISGGVGADTFVWDVKDSYWDPFRIDMKSSGSTIISDFSLAEGDKLDLRDCLIGESGNDVTRLLDYLDVRLEGGNTVVTVSAFGILNNSQYTAEVAEDIHIYLQGVDLFAATSTTSESALLQSLMTSKNLLVDV